MDPLLSFQGCEGKKQSTFGRSYLGAHDIQVKGDETEME